MGEAEGGVDMRWWEAVTGSAGCPATSRIGKIGAQSDEFLVHYTTMSNPGGARMMSP